MRRARPCREPCSWRGTIEGTVDFLLARPDARADGEAHEGRNLALGHGRGSLVNEPLFLRLCKVEDSRHEVLLGELASPAGLELALQAVEAPLVLLTHLD